MTIGIFIYGYGVNSPSRCIDVLKRFEIYSGGVKLLFGVDTLKFIDKFVTSEDKVIVVTGRFSARQSGALSDLEELLKSRGVEYDVWSNAHPNPTDRLVEELAGQIASNDNTVIIAVGGGSVIDLAKSARLIYSCGGSIVKYLYGETPVCSQLKPQLIAVNLTHGTGSEIDRYAVVTITDTKEKLGFNAGYPDVSIDDPKYTITLPYNQSIYVTIDAFAHAVESATSTKSSPYTELLASETIRIISRYLPNLRYNLTDIEHRYWLLYASMLAGISIDHGVTHIGHGLEHALTGLNPNLPHGAGLAIIYTELVRILYKANPVTMCKLLKPLNSDLKPTVDYGDEAQRSYNRFLEEIGFREKLSDYGFGLDSIREIVDTFNKLFPKRYDPLSPIQLNVETVVSLLRRII